MGTSLRTLWTSKCEVRLKRRATYLPEYPNTINWNNDI